MTQPVGTRRPLPALAFLLGLALLTALVWWRVIHRGGEAHAGEAHTTVAAPTSCSASPAHTTPLPLPAAITVQVLNSTQRAGLAGMVGQILTQDGFVSAGAPGNDDLSKHAAVAGVAEIRYGSAGQAGATLLSYYVPGATLVADATRTTAVIDLALGAKFSALAAPADVTKALAAAHLTQSGTPTGAAAHPSC